MILRFDPARRRPSPGAPPVDELDTVIDRLLADEPCDPGAVPADYRPLLRVVGAARSPSTAAELAGEDAAVACFRAGRASARRRRSGRRRRIRAVAVVVAAVAGSATSVAATNLHLPPHVGGLAFDLLTARGVVSAGSLAEPHDPAIGPQNDDVTVAASPPVTGERRPRLPSSPTQRAATIPNGAASASPSPADAALVVAGASTVATADPAPTVAAVSAVPRPGGDGVSGSGDPAAVSRSAGPGVAPTDDPAAAARPDSVSSGPAAPAADILAAPTGDAPAPPPAVPAAPPDHAGPPAGRPAEPPDRVPGPPDHVPGPPPDVPAARPDRAAGPPDHAPGPPDHAPGPPVDVAAGRPERVPGPPADVPAPLDPGL